MSSKICIYKISMYNIDRFYYINKKNGRSKQKFINKFK